MFGEIRTQNTDDPSLGIIPQREQSLFIYYYRLSSCVQSIAVRVLLFLTTQYIFTGVSVRDTLLYFLPQMLTRQSLWHELRRQQ